MSTTVPVDMELKRAFQELQFKMLETSKKLQIADMQIDSLRRIIQHSKLTDQEISTLPSGTPTFEGVGRMFLLTEVADVRSNLENKVRLADEKIKSLEANKTYLERNLKDSEDNLREMVNSKQGK